MKVVSSVRLVTVFAAACASPGSFELTADAGSSFDAKSGADAGPTGDAGVDSAGGELVATPRRIAVGHSHACGITAAGAVKCWGSNSWGNLGDGTSVSRQTATQVVSLASGAIAVTVNTTHTCALTSAGGVRCWGANQQGALGDGTTVQRTTPVDVVGLSSGVVAISAGMYFTCALTSAGGVKCWGYNASGTLGDGTHIDRMTPVDVVGLTSGVIAIAAGTERACAVTSGGAVKCWGSNQDGFLGAGTDATNHPTPVDVVGMSTGRIAVAVGVHPTCALSSGGAIECWGRNDYGALGDGTRSHRRAPVGVVGISSGAQQVAAGSFSTCARTSSGGVKCWGSNQLGAVGDGATTDRTTPVDVVGLSSGVIDVSAGTMRACALTNGHIAKCWGSNTSGALGDGTSIDRTSPVDVVGF